MDENPISKWLTVTPKEIYLGVIERAVVAQLHFHSEHFGLAPGVGLAIRMSPAEAREIADKLRKTADEAEAGLPRA